jgi:hypothetical protein
LIIHNAPKTTGSQSGVKKTDGLQPGQIIFNCIVANLLVKKYGDVQASCKQVVSVAQKKHYAPFFTNLGVTGRLSRWAHLSNP